MATAKPAPRATFQEKVEHRDSVLDEDARQTMLQVCASRAMPGENLVLDL